MPKKLPDDLSERIEAEIVRYVEGVGIDELHAALAQIISRRTLQRRLANLIEQKRVFTFGKGPGLRYRQSQIIDARMHEPALAANSPSTEVDIPVSPEGEEIRRYVRQSRQQRAPVSYKQSFLEQYTPNSTTYLPESLRTQLHNLGRPGVSAVEDAPAGTFARDILNRLLIDLSWASSQLEGNTYSRLDTERLIEYGQAAAGKDALETQMILNHKAAIEYLVRDTEHVAVNPETVIALHAFLSDGLMPDPATCGRLRNRPVEIGGSVYLPVALPQRIEELFGVIIEMAGEILDPFEQAFFLMVHLPYLQPFEDVNKRVSRLAANIPFIRYNLSPLSFIDVAAKDYIEALLGVYELNRVELLRDIFVRAYERSCQQYVAVRQQLIPPDAVRLRYRTQLSALVAAIVRSGAKADLAVIRAQVPGAVAEADRERFVALAMEEFQNLHSGNAIRFGLRPLEFAVWQEKNAGEN
ncbi:Fic family protein [candidate division WWE3 bacterium]|uniref:Fic family protein n=1 Tax=candidate division WWE3 bacterium TaxID=2053526 RepID=A0A928TUW8_UNCKA|nr:Fic family protein [candidate division WWE3 bacterium]